MRTRRLQQVYWRRLHKGVTMKACQPPPVDAPDMGRRMHVDLNMDAENRADATKQKTRRQPCCGFCRNHKLEVPVMNHHCVYATCNCNFCELTRLRRKIMCHQQRLWRYKKLLALQKDVEENPSEGEVTPNNNFQQEEQQLDLLDQAKQQGKRKMVCDKCRNHNVIVNKRGHKGSCKFEDCKCDLCSFTIKRQRFMKHQQRVRRSQIARPTEYTEKSPQPLTNADSPDSDVHPLEEVASPSPPRGRLEDRKEEGTEARSPHIPAAPLDMLPTAPRSSVMACAMEDAPRPQDNQFHPVTSTTCQPPPLEPMPDDQVTSDIHSTLMFNNREHNLNSPAGIECSRNTRLPMGCGRYGQIPQVPAASTTLPSHQYGLDAGQQRFMPWTGRVSETSERCLVEAKNVRPQAPFRPQPIPAARLPPPQMDWQFLGFPYPQASMLQSVQQHTLSACDNFRPHHPQAGLDEQWHGTRASHLTESNGVQHSPYSAGLPYFASALLHPGAKPSLSLMPTCRTLPDYGSPLPGFRQRGQHQANPLGIFTRSCNNVM